MQNHGGNPDHSSTGEFGRIHIGPRRLLVTGPGRDRLVGVDVSDRTPRAPRKRCRLGHVYPISTTTSGKHRVCPECQAQRPARPCDVRGCPRPHRTGGHCDLHAQRLRKNGSLADPVARTPGQRFWMKVDKQGAPPDCQPTLGHCWLWTGGKSTSFNDGAGPVLARRWAWADANGPLPKDRPELRAICRQWLCVRPDHAEAVSRTEVCSAQILNVCLRGHVFDEENTHVNARGGRSCRACRRVRALKWRTENPHLQKQRARRTWLRSVGTTDDLAYLDIIAGDPCVYCGSAMEAVDHIKPLFRGGDSGWMNLAPACKSCNSSKHASDLLTFMLRRLGT